jgi:hypothetical protein
MEPGDACLFKGKAQERMAALSSSYAMAECSLFFASRGDVGAESPLKDSRPGNIRLFLFSFEDGGESVHTAFGGSGASPTLSAWGMRSAARYMHAEVQIFIEAIKK